VGDLPPTFRIQAVLPPSGVQTCAESGGTTGVGKVENRSPSEEASHPIMPVCSGTALSELQMSQFLNSLIAGDQKFSKNLDKVVKFTVQPAMKSQIKGRGTALLFL
jgi:hypothetical protein